MYAGDAREGLDVLRPLATFDVPLETTAAEVPYRRVQQTFDAILPNTGEVIGYWKSLYAEDLSDEAIEMVAELSAHRTSPSTMMLVAHLGEGSDAFRRRPPPLPPAAPRSW